MSSIEDKANQTNEHQAELSEDARVVEILTADFRTCWGKRGRIFYGSTTRVLLRGDSRAVDECEVEVEAGTFISEVFAGTVFSTEKTWSDTNIDTRGGSHVQTSGDGVVRHNRQARTAGSHLM